MKREAFFDRDASHYYCEDGKAVGAYCREQFSEDVAQTLAVADGVCRKYFLFNSKWDLEQTDEPVQFDGAIDWTYMPADDPGICLAVQQTPLFHDARSGVSDDRG